MKKPKCLKLVSLMLAVVLLLCQLPAITVEAADVGIGIQEMISAQIANPGAVISHAGAKVDYQFLYGSFDNKTLTPFTASTGGYLYQGNAGEPTNAVWTHQWRCNNGSDTVLKITARENMYFKSEIQEGGQFHAGWAVGSKFRFVQENTAGNRSVIQTIEVKSAAQSVEDSTVVTHLAAGESLYIVYSGDGLKTTDFCPWFTFNTETYNASQNSIQTVNPDYFYGMDYIAYEGFFNGIDYEKAFKLMANMGVKSIRHWMHVTWFFDENFNVIQSNVDLMKDIIAEAQKYGFQLIGVSHRNINKYGPEHQGDKVAPTSDYYEEWLANYERGWYELVKTFPEITIWEIDNETNGTDFMHDAEGKVDNFGAAVRAHISTDMFYYGSKGVHRANPDAITVMGGFLVMDQWGDPDFLERVYQNIQSGNFGEGSTDPDDYFQCLAWHPYYHALNEAHFIEVQQDLYNTVLKYEGKDKKVYFTELGNWTQWQTNEQTAANYVKRVYEITAEHLPWVESIHYYRAFDNIVDNNCQGGLFADPNPNREDINPATGQRRDPGAPKPAAYAYQQAAGGTGSLEIFTSNTAANVGVGIQNMIDMQVANLGSVISDHGADIDYQFLYGSFDNKSLTPYSANSGDSLYMGNAGDPTAAVWTWQWRCNAGSDTVLKITAKKDMTFKSEIQEDGKFDAGWATGSSFRFVQENAEGERKLVKTISVLSVEQSVENSTVTTHLAAGESLYIVYSAPGSSTTNFCPWFTLNTDAYDAAQNPFYTAWTPSASDKHLTIQEMVTAQIANPGAVVSNAAANVDYQFLHGSFSNGSLTPYTTSGGDYLYVGSSSNPTNAVWKWQWRCDSGSDAVLKITARKNMIFRSAIQDGGQFHAGWAIGSVIRFVQENAAGERKVVKTIIVKDKAQSVIDSSVIAHLAAGESLYIIYTGSYSVTTDFCPQFTVNTEGYDAKQNLFQNTPVIDKTVISLKEDLTVKVLVPMNKITGTNNVLTFTKYNADGTVDEILNIPQAQWAVHDANNLKVSLPGVSAKEMGSKITAAITNTNGDVISAVYEDSVKDYLQRLWDLAVSQNNAELKTLAVDLLNYGAMAQTIFGHDTANLVNADLTGDQLACASQTAPTLENGLDKDDPKGLYYGSTLLLKDKLQMRFIFRNIEAGMYATVSYYNHAGDVVVTDQAIDLVRKDENYHTVTVDTLAMADYNTEVTVTIYNSDGSVAAVILDTMAGYLNRVAKPEYTPIAKAMAAAYAYLH